MAKRQQFIYFLKLVPRLLDEKNWTKADSEIVDRHFARLQRLLGEGKLILAGRTQDTDPTGIVILDVASEDEARSLMEGDPTVREGIMTAQLYPYKVALIRPAPDGPRLCAHASE